MQGKHILTVPDEKHLGNLIGNGIFYKIIENSKNYMYKKHQFAHGTVL